MKETDRRSEVSRDLLGVLGLVGPILGVVAGDLIIVVGVVKPERDALLEALVLAEINDEDLQARAADYLDADLLPYIPAETKHFPAPVRFRTAW